MEDNVKRQVLLTQSEDFGTWSIYVDGILQAAPFWSFIEAVEYLAIKGDQFDLKGTLYQGEAINGRQDR